MKNFELILSVPITTKKVILQANNRQDAERLGLEYAIENGMILVDINDNPKANFDYNVHKTANIDQL